MRLMSVVVILLVVSLMASGITAIVVTFATYYNVIEYEAEMTVAERNTVGLNVENDKIYFGRLPSPGVSTRNILVKNALDEPAKIDFFATGNIAPYIYFPFQGQVINAHEEATLQVEAHVPENTPLGNYTGKVTIFFRKIR